MDRPIEVAIGLGGTYLFLSIIVLAINEGVAGFFNRRGMMLKETIEGLLTGKITKQLAEHPLVATLASAGRKREKVKFPSYLGTSTFSQAMIDVIAETSEAKQQIGVAYQKFLVGLNAADENQAKQVKQIIGDTVESVEQLQKRLETWFNNSMDRLSGAYKRRTQWFSRGFAAALVLAMNINTIEMTKTLWTNPEMRAAAVKKAQAIVDQCDQTQKMTQPRPTAPDPMPGQPPGQPQPNVTGAPVDVATQPQPQPQPQPDTNGVQQGGKCPDLIKETETMLPLPISGRFWDTMGSGITAIFGIAFWTTLLGLLLSIWAVSLGAPFWFDTLRKLSGGIGIQQSGPKPKS